LEFIGCFFFLKKMRADTYSPGKWICLILNQFSQVLPMETMANLVDYLATCIENPGNLKPSRHSVLPLIQPVAMSAKAVA